MSGGAGPCLVLLTTAAGGMMPSGSARTLLASLVAGCGRVRVGSSDAWPAPLGQWSGPLRHSPGVVKGATQHHLDLGVEAAQLIGRPLR